MGFVFHNYYICLDHQEQSSGAFPVTEVGAGVGATLLMVMVFVIVAFVLIRYSHRFYNINICKYLRSVYISVIDQQTRSNFSIFTFLSFFVIKLQVEYRFYFSRILSLAQCLKFMCSTASRSFNRFVKQSTSLEKSMYQMMYTSCWSTCGVCMIK